MKLRPLMHWQLLEFETFIGRYEKMNRVNNSNMTFQPNCIDIHGYMNLDVLAYMQLWKIWFGKTVCAWKNFTVLAYKRQLCTKVDYIKNRRICKQCFFSYRNKCDINLDQHTDLTATSDCGFPTAGWHRTRKNTLITHHEDNLRKYDHVMENRCLATSS